MMLQMSLVLISVAAVGDDMARHALAACCGGRDKNVNATRTLVKLWKYFACNVVQIATALVTHYLAAHGGLLGVYLGCVFRDTLMVVIFTLRGKQLPCIHDNDSSNAKNKKLEVDSAWMAIEAARMILTNGVAESISMCSSAWLFNMPPSRQNAMIMPSQVLEEFVPFILIGFMWEVVFDFIFYWVHRAFHAVPWIYRAFHKEHHKHLQPTPIATYENSLISRMIEASIPEVLAMAVCPQMTSFQLHLLYSYKVTQEVAGHSGIDYARATGFVQCMWLPRAFGMESSVKDHDYHHAVSMCNFSKRFTLWDKVFGTHSRPKSASSSTTKVHNATLTSMAKAETEKPRD